MIILLFFLNQLSFCGKFSAPFRLMMKFVVKPSLERIALVKIVVSLWNQNDVRALISKLCQGDVCRREEWKTIEERVIQKVTQLSLPHLLKEKVLCFVKPIGLELLEWMKYHNRYNAWMDLHHTGLPAHLPAEFCWTQQGAVDRKRTAEMLVRDENLDVSTHYILACVYCLEGDIIRFWKSLPEDLKDYDWNNFPVTTFWSDNMKRGGVGHISYKYIFCWSAYEGNKVAAEYFLQKLTPQEREELLKELVEDIRHADVVCFLLSKMDEGQQMEVFNKSPYRILRCFLQWPWQGFFIGVANSMWDFLSKSNYIKILRGIITKVEKGYKDYNYQNLFREFWQESPSPLKDSFIEEIDKSWILQSLFDCKDKEIIRLILKDASFSVKKKLIYSEEIDYYLRRSIHRNEWDFLEFFIRECLASKNEMLKFKQEFEKRMYFKECSATKKHTWDQIFSFSDDST